MEGEGSGSEGCMDREAQLGDCVLALPTCPEAPGQPWIPTSSSGVPSVSGCSGDGILDLQASPSGPGTVGGGSLYTSWFLLLMTSEPSPSSGRGGSGEQDECSRSHTVELLRIQAKQMGYSGVFSLNWAKSTLRSNSLITYVSGVVR